MSEYTEQVESGLKGLTAVSTGVCPGCDECRTNHDDYTPQDGGPPWDEGPEDSFWLRAEDEPNKPRIWYATEEQAEAVAKVLFEEAWSSGAVYSEPSFSWSSCGICNSHLGGDREVWHALDDLTGTLYHFDDACVDCVVYLANGDEPEEQV